MAAWVLSAPSAASRARNRSSRSALTVPPSCATLVIGESLPVSTVPGDVPRRLGGVLPFVLQGSRRLWLTLPLRGIVMSGRWLDHRCPRLEG